MAVMAVKTVMAVMAVMTVMAVKAAMAVKTVMAAKTAMAVMEETEDGRRKGVPCPGTEESILSTRY